MNNIEVMVSSLETKRSETISISVPTHIYVWLEAHKNINRSRVFQEAILKLMNPQTNRMPPVMFLASVMGICLSVSLILASIGLYVWLGIYMSSVMFCIGAALLAITIMTVVNIKKHARI